MKTIRNLTPLTQSLEGETRSKLLSTKRLTRVRVFHNVITWLNTRQIKEQITTPRPFKHPLLTVGNDGNKFPNSSKGLSELFDRRENPQKGRKDGRRVSVTTIWVELNDEQFRQLVFDLKDWANADSYDIFKKSLDWNLPNCISLSYIASKLIFDCFSLLTCLLCHLFQGYLKWQPLFPLSKISKSLSWTMTSLDEMTSSVKPQLTWSRGY